MQATRTRLHREQAVKSIQGAHCAVCHQLVFRDRMDCYWLDRVRRIRVCLACKHTEKE